MTKTSVITNMLWRFAERCGAQGVSFIVSLVLARLLEPEVYGVVSLITVFTTILNLFIDSGFKNALIQKTNADQLDFSTVFFFNVTLGAVLYLGMFAASPAIARFYEKDYMVPYIRVMSLTLILGGINGVQTAVVAKRMEFKRFFFATLDGTVISAFIGIGMAYMGMGVWALIAQRLVNQLIDTVILWHTVRWRPSLEFSMERLKPMFAYGSRILASSLLNSFTSNLSGLLVGKVYSSDMLAYYDKGRRVPFLVVENLQSTVQSVLFPFIAEQQGEKEQVHRILKQSIMISAYCIFPCMVGIAVCAQPLVRILYTEKWIEMVPYVQLWSFSCAFFLIHTANLQVIQALGCSDIFLKIEVVKQLISMIGIVIAIPFGVLPLLVSNCVVTVISAYINARPVKELIGYGIAEQIRDISPILLLNVIMGGIVWLVGFISLPDSVLLILQVFTGGIVYLVGSVLMKLEIFRYILMTVRQILHKSQD